jgi:hypothetical protein
MMNLCAEIGKNSDSFSGRMQKSEESATNPRSRYNHFPFESIFG